MLTSNARIQINTISHSIRWETSNYHKEDEELSERFDAYRAEFDDDIDLAEGIILILQHPTYYSWADYNVMINKLAQMMSENDDIHEAIIQYRWVGRYHMLYKIAAQTHSLQATTNLYRAIKKFGHLFEDARDRHGRQSLMKFFRKDRPKIYQYYMENFVKCI